MRPETERGADADFTDPPLGVIDRDHFIAGVSYTIRFTIIRSELKQIHERFGPHGIKGVIRDESRGAIQSAFTDGNHRVIDLGGPSRAALESMLFERIKERLAANGFALVFFSLQEPDLRELGQILREQAMEQAGLTLEEVRTRIDEVSHRRSEATAHVEARIEAERIRARAAAEADAVMIRARADADAEDERAIRRASATGKAKEIEIAKRLELAGMEADLRVRRADALARTNRVLADELSELLVRLESIEIWRDVMERWDGRVAPPALSGIVSTPLSPSVFAQPDNGAPGADERQPASLIPNEVQRYGE